MLFGLIVGVVISLFQALTQIQEMTLVFVPKIIAIFAAMIVALPFYGRRAAKLYGPAHCENRRRRLNGRSVCA
jgi:flagellar biosynthetic protein FliQ